MRSSRALGTAFAFTVIMSLSGAPAAVAHEGAEVIAAVGPFTRGIEVGPNGAVTLAENAFDAAENPTEATLRILRQRHGAWQSETIGTVEDAIIDVANKASGKGSLFLLSASQAVGGSGDVTKWSPGAPRTLANITAWREDHPDPYDREGDPFDTNQWAVAPLADGSVLVADAGGNEVVRVHTNGRIESVAQFTTVPSGTDAPPVSEAVPTSVAVGPDGAWYVGQLVGFPGLPGTARVYRIEAGTTGTLCEPEPAADAACTVFATGFTSIMDIDFGPDGSLYVLELSKLGWAALEIFGTPGSEIGALWKVTDGTRTELAADELVIPGGLAVGPDGAAYVTTNFLGVPGVTPQLVRVH